MVASRQYVEHILTSFRLAAGANAETPGRRGNVIELGPELAADVLVTGDLHGHRQNYHRICRLAALDENPRRHLVLQEVCHGGPTYPRSGGCMSHTVLEDVAALKTKYPGRVHFILANHELAELTGYPIQKNGELLNAQFRLGLKHMYGRAVESVQDAYRQFLSTCPLAVRVMPGIFISHSIPETAGDGRFEAAVFARPLTDDDYRVGGSLFELVWGRDYRGQNARAFAEMVGANVLITGHEPCPEGVAMANDRQIILDCSGQNAAYVILPVGVSLERDQIMGRVERLAGNDDS
jgi:hypothetical protein